MKIKSTLCAAMLAVTATGSAWAVTYPGSTTQSYSFAATTTGDIMAYFYGQDAGYTEVLGMLVNGSAPTMDGNVGLSNHSAAVVQGTPMDLGYALAGQTITFYIQVTSGSSDKWYSDIASNSDGTNHIYSTGFTPTTTLPGTIFISFEDLPTKSSDHDYNDTSFVIKGVTAVPEPTNLALLLGGLGLMGYMARRRRG